MTGTADPWSPMAPPKGINFSRSNLLNYLKNRHFQPETVNIEPLSINCYLLCVPFSRSTAFFRYMAEVASSPLRP
jgi:hypothetical protein